MMSTYFSHSFDSLYLLSYNVRIWIPFLLGRPISGYNLSHPFSQCILTNWQDANQNMMIRSTLNFDKTMKYSACNQFMLFWICWKSCLKCSSFQQAVRNWSKIIVSLVHLKQLALLPFAKELADERKIGISHERCYY